MKKKGFEKIGTLTVYTTDEPGKWAYNSKNESLAFLELETNGIKLWDSICVGITEAKLLNFIGSDIYEKKGSILHSKLGRYNSSFTINNDTISKIRILKPCDT